LHAIMQVLTKYIKQALKLVWCKFKKQVIFV